MIRLGILGGGQLGRMLLQQAVNYPVETFVLENDENCPAAHLCHHFYKGDIRDYETVMAFGKLTDVITIEIENVNIDALEQLEKEGVKVIPKPAVLRTIKSKIRQKEFYRTNEIPSPPFHVTHTRADLDQYADFLPAVHKLAEGGYDGKGVQVIKSVQDKTLGFDKPSVLEKMVDIDKELAVIVAVAETSQPVLFPPVEMVFDPKLNLLDFQLCPALVPEKVIWRLEAIAFKLAKAFNSPGLFAIELLLHRNGELWVNETPPRVHNSGHHTIEAHVTSQYDMLLRILLGYPLGNPAMLKPSVLVNLIGDKEQSGDVYYSRLTDLLKIEGTYLHAYGKKESRSGRKMGHVTALGTDKVDLVVKARQIKQILHEK